MNLSNWMEDNGRNLMIETKNQRKDEGKLDEG